VLLGNGISEKRKEDEPWILQGILNQLKKKRDLQSPDSSL
jgi:hypothetical protein